MNGGRAVRRPLVARLVQQVRAQGLTYLSTGALMDLDDAVRRLERQGIAGDVVEAGTALGGSAVVLARAKARTRPLHLYDVFGQIPPPSDEDGELVQARYADIVEGRAEGLKGATYYGYRDDLVEEVRGTLRRFGADPDASAIHLHQGLFEDTLQPAGPVALAHLDGDWYASVKVCLDRLHPVLVPGGRFVIDDYGAWDGCTRAVDEFLAAHPDYDRRQASRLHLIRR